MVPLLNKFSRNHSVAAVDGPALLRRQSDGAKNNGETACGDVDW
jgi:hypothetical protein